MLNKDFEDGEVDETVEVTTNKDLKLDDWHFEALNAALEVVGNETSSLIAIPSLGHWNDIWLLLHRLAFRSLQISVLELMRNRSCTVLILFKIDIKQRKS